MEMLLLQMRRVPLGLRGSLQAGPLQGGVDHLPVRLRGAQEQRLPDAGSQAAGGNQVLEGNGVPGSPALSDVVGVETKRVTWVRDRNKWRFPGQTAGRHCP